MNDEELPYAQEISPLDNIDWKQYFDDFCDAHGKYPIVYTDPINENKLLLFPDGWRYSCLSHEGPEYAPPTDKQQLKRLKVLYWTRRKIIVSTEHRELDNLIRQTEAIISSRSIPLKISKTIMNDDGKLERYNDKLDVEHMKQRLQWLWDDMIQCEQMLNDAKTI